MRLYQGNAKELVGIAIEEWVVVIRWKLLSLMEFRM